MPGLNGMEGPPPALSATLSLAGTPSEQSKLNSELKPGALPFGGHCRVGLWGSLC